MYLESIVCPTSKLHYTSLLVERKVLHVHLAGGVVDGGGLPLVVDREGEIKGKENKWQGLALGLALGLEKTLHIENKLKNIN